MKRNSTAKNIAQIAALSIITCMSMIALILTPAWFFFLFATKIIAAAGFYAAYRLYEAWKKRNKWLAAYDRACREVDEAPNPMYIGKEGRG